MGFGVARGCSVDRTMSGARCLRHPLPIRSALPDCLVCRRPGSPRAHRSPVLRGRPLPLRSVARRGRNAKCVGFSRGDPSIAIVSGTISAGKSGERVPATRPVRINPAHFNSNTPPRGLRASSVCEWELLQWEVCRWRVASVGVIPLAKTTKACVRAFVLAPSVRFSNV